MRFTTEVQLDAGGPFDLKAALGTLTAHYVEGQHGFDPGAASLTRWIVTHGEPHLLAVRLHADGVIVTTATRDEGLNEAISARVRHWFDLDTDLEPINAALGADPVFASQVASRPGIRITRFHAPFEAVALTVLGQQVSLAAGRLFAARLVRAFGAAPPSGGGADGLYPFPTAARLATVPTDELRAAIGITGTRARTLREVATLFAESDSAQVRNDEQLPDRESLMAVHGIGPWTADFVAIRAGTEPDAFPGSDAVLRKTLQAIIPSATADRPASWRPYRSYAATRLWALAA